MLPFGSCVEQSERLKTDIKTGSENFEPYFCAKNGGKNEFVHRQERERKSLLSIERNGQKAKKNEFLSGLGFGFYWKSPPREDRTGVGEKFDKPRQEGNGLHETWPHDRRLLVIFKYRRNYCLSPPARKSQNHQEGLSEEVQSFGKNIPGFSRAGQSFLLHGWTGTFTVQVLFDRSEASIINTKIGLEPSELIFMIRGVTPLAWHD
jgi:hypothetical protein